MLKIPENFRKNVINRYNKKGKEWLENLDNIVNKYVTKFGLENIKIIEELSMNLVLFAKSKKYGDIVLKINTPGKTAIREINIMKQYHIKNMVKCYYTNVNDKVLILERIIPGYSLDNVENKSERVKLFCDVLNKYSILNDGKNKFPTYEEKLKDLLKYVSDNKSKYIDIENLIEKMKNLYAEIQKMNLDKYILHFDLNHRNILKSENDWKVIDPQGVIGEKIIDTAQFIRGEIQMSNADMSEFYQIVSLISEELGEDKNLVLKSLYIVIIEKIIWFIKTRHSKEIVSYNIDIANKVLKLINM